jgi:hypothetical protein
MSLGISSSSTGALHMYPATLTVQSVRSAVQRALGKPFLISSPYTELRKECHYAHVDETPCLIKG